MPLEEHDSQLEEIYSITPDKSEASQAGLHIPEDATLLDRETTDGGELRLYALPDRILAALDEVQTDARYIFGDTVVHKLLAVTGSDDIARILLYTTNNTQTFPQIHAELSTLQDTSIQEKDYLEIGTRAGRQHRFRNFSTIKGVYDVEQDWLFIPLDLHSRAFTDIEFSRGEDASGSHYTVSQLNYLVYRLWGLSEDDYVPYDSLVENDSLEHIKRVQYVDVRTTNEGSLYVDKGRNSLGNTADALTNLGISTIDSLPVFRGEGSLLNHYELLHKVKIDDSAWQNYWDLQEGKASNYENFVQYTAVRDLVNSVRYSLTQGMEVSGLESDQTLYKILSVWDDDAEMVRAFMTKDNIREGFPIGAVLALPKNDAEFPSLNNGRELVGLVIGKNHEKPMERAGWYKDYDNVCLEGRLVLRAVADSATEFCYEVLLFPQARNFDGSPVNSALQVRVENHLRALEETSTSLNSYKVGTIIKVTSMEA